MMMPARRRLDERNITRAARAMQYAIGKARDIVSERSCVQLKHGRAQGAMLVYSVMCDPISLDSRRL